MVVAIAVTCLAFAPPRDDTDRAALALHDATAAQSAADALRDKNALDPDDLDYSRDYVKELANLADQTKDPALKEFASGVHLVTAWVLATAVTLHVAGALKHALVNRDGLLARMGIGSAGD